MNNIGVYLRLALATLSWGAVFHIGKYAVTAMTPLSIGAWRFIIAGIVLLPIAWMNGAWQRTSLTRNIWPLLAMSAFGVFGFNVALFYGLRTTSSVNGALIMAFNPALTVVLSALINRERVSARQLLGLLISMTGVLVVVSHGSWHALTTLSFSHGDLLVMLASLSWAIYSVIPKRFIHGLDPMQVTVATIIGGAVMMGVLAAAAMPDFFQQPSMPVLAAILFMGLFGSVLAYLCWNQGVQRIGAARAAIFINMVPMFAALIGVLLGQPITLAQVIGAALVISGVVLSSIAQTGRT